MYFNSKVIMYTDIACTKFYCKMIKIWLEIKQNEFYNSYIKRNFSIFIPNYFYFVFIGQIKSGMHDKWNSDQWVEKASAFKINRNRHIILI